NAGYVFGVDAKGNPERAARQRAAFAAAIRERIPGAVADQGVSAVLRWLDGSDDERVRADAHWEEASGGAANIGFRLDGENGLISQRSAVVAALAGEAGGERRACLVTGEMDVPARLHPSIKGVLGAQSSGADIVSFNQHSFRSHGWKQGSNAPVGDRAAFAYTTALNHLLGRDSRQRLQVGDATTVFWAEREHPMENLVAAWLGEPPRDDPDRNTEALRSLYAAPRSGTLAVSDDDDTPFYVLGLAPNAARIAVRHWWRGTAGELAAHIRQHFEDLRIDRGPRDPATLSIFRILVATAALGKAENIRPNLAGAFLRAVLEDDPYPRELLGAALLRIRADRQVTYPRAALIKGWLNREARRAPDPHTLEVSVSLDPTNPNRAYRLGRLFAVLERAQEESSPGVNATIRDRYFGAAATTPVTVFPRLLILKNHHLKKMDNRGRVVNLEKLIGEIVDGIDDYPPILSLPDQGQFSIGYYHQRQSFFAPRDTQPQPEA
ncbi:MAG TPA: type I-C CRISPR-associated protein Cas8c/Csd1, partial [Longimicrobium sp.]|nr:type I-C CRISPR-associated protein Cas8c/Csd1 [Longimicrobium sp.]